MSAQSTRLSGMKPRLFAVRLDIKGIVRVDTILLLDMWMKLR